MGIRPEDLHDDDWWLEKSAKSVITAVVRVYELLGSVVNLYFDVEDSNFTATVNPKTPARVGSTVKVALDLSKLHIFDKDTENVIVN